MEKVKHASHRARQPEKRPSGSNGAAHLRPGLHPPHTLKTNRGLLLELQARNDEAQRVSHAGPIPIVYRHT
jgi:hypothetical protein